MNNLATIVKAKNMQNIKEGIFLFVVYEPNVLDAHGDWATAEEIEKACYEFNRQMRFKTAVDTQHDFKSNGSEILESYIMPVDVEIEEQLIQSGTWMVKIKIYDEQLLEDFKTGRKTGVSMAGSAIVEEV